MMGFDEKVYFILLILCLLVEWEELYLGKCFLVFVMGNVSQGVGIFQ